MYDTNSPTIDADIQPPLQPVAPRSVPQHQPCHSIRARSWIAVYTHAQAERWADGNLRHLGYTTFLPLVSVLRRDRVVQSMRHRVMVPLWPRYLFVVFDAASASWSPIRACPGVSDLVRCGKEIPRIEDAAVEAVRSALQADAIAAAGGDAQSAQRRPGEAVRLVAGVMQGHRGVVLSSGKLGVLVSLMLLGALRSIMVPAECLESADAE